MSVALTVSVVLTAGAIGAALGYLGAREQHWTTRLLSVALGWSLAMGGAVMVAPSHADAELDRAVPAFVNDEGYAGSDTCRSCHPGQYHSWRETYHRTMTQVATPAAVLAPFDGRVLRERGRAFAPVQEGDRYYVVEVDPAHEGPFELEGRWWEGQRSVWRVAMTTGSHHLQAYWVHAASGRLEQLPFVYLIGEGRWMANSDSFLQPPPAEDEALRRYVWGDECAVCHTTGGPWDGPEARAEEVAVTELGIACEGCHGPAAAHVEANRSPARRYALHSVQEGDGAMIANARRLDHDRASSICGRCHAIHPVEEIGDGLNAYLPGERLGDFADVTLLFDLVERARLAEDLSELSEAERDDVGAFWDDGTVRVAGREYSGMVRSGCYLEGEMSCSSCHSLHRGPRERQIDPEVRGDAMCVTCHAEIAEDPEAHTHHPMASEGSRCVSCHMAYQSYGLLSATRSHRMDGPTAVGDRTRARPNACNLCHLDRPLGWTADHLTAWYGQPRPELPTHHETQPAGVVWMMTGDAAQRGVVAWHVGWDPAREAADVERVRPALALLMEDPYSAVRQLAAHAAREIDPDAPLDIDDLTRDPSPAMREALLERWGADPDALPTYFTLRERRDDTPTWVSE